MNLKKIPDRSQKILDVVVWVVRIAIFAFMVYFLKFVYKVLGWDGVIFALLGVTIVILSSFLSLVNRYRT